MSFGDGTFTVRRSSEPTTPCYGTYSIKKGKNGIKIVKKLQNHDIMDTKKSRKRFQKIHKNFNMWKFKF